jgi:polyhydroxyalkanoate synthesis repressor PhaR
MACDTLSHQAFLTFHGRTPLMLNKPDPQAEKRETVVIKKYANRRLYNTETSSYVTLDDLGTMVRSDRDFVVYDAKTGDDLTHGVLTQIIVEQESRGTGPSMLPIPFLRQLIRFYDDSMAKMVPGYLQFSLESLAKEQTKFRTQFASAFGSPTAAFDVYQEQVRKNMELFEQALTMWVASPGGQASTETKKPASTSSLQPGQPGYSQPLPQVRTTQIAPPATTDKKEQPRDELSELRAQLAAMQQRIERIAQTRD